MQTKTKIFMMQDVLEQRYLSTGLSKDYHGTEEYRIMVAIENPISEMFWEFEWIIKDEINEHLRRYE
jgi:hypothetical protein